jgi:CubicO group peptidase (beta-lactamase class C family)
MFDGTGDVPVLMQGFPPPPDQRVTLENWQLTPYNRWSFHHVREVVPTARVARGAGLPHVPPDRREDVALLPVTRADGSLSTVGSVMASTSTDGWMALRNGHVVAEDYPGEMPPDSTHLLMSVTKSFVGCVAGILADRGVLDVQETVTTYVPELASGGYDGATVRHLLDMRSGIDFSEDYLDPYAEVRVLEEVIGWRPRGTPTLPTAMYDYLPTLSKAGPHGGPFSYRSCETDVLGWACERASGQRMPELLSDLLWSRLGAEFDADFAVDPAGAAMHDGGLSTTLRDLGRFGQTLLAEGAAADGTQVIPAWWISDSYTGEADSRAAFSASPSDTRMPGGMYRNQFWLPFPDRRLLLCLGIHGQMVYVNPAAGVVGVKLSSWELPQHAAMLFDTIAAFDAVARAG